MCYLNDIRSLGPVEGKRLKMGEQRKQDVSFAEPVSCVFVISLKMKWMQDRARNGDPLMKRLFLESWLLSFLLIVDKLQIGAT